MRNNTDYRIVFQYDDKVQRQFKYTFEYFGYLDPTPIDELILNFTEDYPRYSILKVEDYK